MNSLGSRARIQRTDVQWDVIQPLLLPPARTWRPRADDWKPIEGILFVLITGCRSQDVPREYGAPTTIKTRRFGQRSLRTEPPSDILAATPGRHAEWSVVVPAERPASRARPSPVPSGEALPSTKERTMTPPSQPTAPGSNWLALVSLIAGLVFPLAMAQGWLITYSPLTLEAYPGLLAILDGTLVAVGVIAALSAVVVGIIALIRAERYPSGKSHTGFAIAGLALGGLEVITILLLAVALVVVLVDMAIQYMG
jgi:transposase